MVKKSKICFICDQKAELHFPPHFKDVYGAMLQARGYDTTILAHCMDTRNTAAINLQKEGILLLYKNPAEGIIGRVFHTLQQAFTLCRILLRQEGFCDADIYVVHNDPLAATLCWVKARLGRKRFVYRITHLMAEEAMLRDDLGKHWKRIGKIAQIWRNFLIRHSDYVLPMSAEMVRTLQLQTRMPEGRVVPFVSMIDFRTWHERDESLLESIRVRMNTFGLKRWICYVGTLSPGRELNLIIETLAELRKIMPEAGLLVFGVASKLEYLTRLQEHACELKVNDYILWHEAVPENQLPHVLSLADVGLSPFPVNAVMRNNSPLKILEYLRAGIPVVASPIPDHEEVISGTQGGLIAEYTSGAFAQACFVLARETGEARAARMASARKWLLENRDLSKACDLLEDVFIAVKSRGSVSPSVRRIPLQ